MDRKTYATLAVAFTKNEFLNIVLKTDLRFLQCTAAGHTQTLQRNYKHFPLSPEQNFSTVCEVMFWN